MFPICDEADSCTKTTSYAIAPWLGEGPDFTVVDTPGNNSIVWVTDLAMAASEKISAEHL